MHTHNVNCIADFVHKENDKFYFSCTTEQQQG